MNARDLLGDLMDIHIIIILTMNAHDLLGDLMDIHIIIHIATCTCVGDGIQYNGIEPG